MFTESALTGVNAMDSRRAGRAMAHTPEGREAEHDVCALMEACIGRCWPGRRVRFFPIPDDIEGDLLTEAGL